MAHQKSVRTSTSKAANAEIELVDLTPDELKRLPHPREGFEAHVAPLLAIYEQEREELLIKSLDVGAIEESLQTYQALAAEETAARKHLEMVEETRALHASKVWTGMLAIYTKGQAVGRTNKNVERGIADFAEFMATGPRKKPEKAEKPEKKEP